MSSPTIYWHDFETWGTDPRKDPACQFAGIRTDLDLNIIGKPLNILSRIASDTLPQPGACLVTGITPQHTLRDGMPEAEFIARIMQEFTQAQTCVAGYNSIRFDDEVTRNTLFRNFYDPYAREWQNGNSRWDIIDLVRTCYALRPEGINWPTNESGAPSFKLEHLSAANQIEHSDAHDAMSDVYATIGLAKLIKTKQPKLFDYVFNLRKKQEVAKYLDVHGMKPFFHVSAKLPAVNGCSTWMVPIAYHPENKNAVICANLQLDPTPLLELDADTLREKLYTPTALLEEGEERLPLKLVHLNKCPVVASAKVLDQDNAERLGIDRQRCLQHLKILQSAHGIQQKVAQVYEQTREAEQVDVDLSLYSGGFFSEHDRALMEQIRQEKPDMLGARDWQFEDSRLKTLLFRYRARNFPQTLTHDEAQRWQAHRQSKFLEGNAGASITLPEYMQQIELLMHQHENDGNKKAILRALVQYAENL